MQHRHTHTHNQSVRNSHKDKHTHFPPHSKTNAVLLTAHAHIISLCHCASSSLSLSPSFFPLCFALHYLSGHLQCVVISPSISSPSRSSPAKGSCPFIIHGVVLMAQAAMSDVNLCTSKAQSAYTASAGGGYLLELPRSGTVRDYGITLNHTWVTQPMQIFCFCFNLQQTAPPFYECQFHVCFLCSPKQSAGHKCLIIRRVMMITLYRVFDKTVIRINMNEINY